MTVSTERGKEVIAAEAGEVTVADPVSVVAGVTAADRRVALGADKVEVEAGGKVEASAADERVATLAAGEKAATSEVGEKAATSEVGEKVAVVATETDPEVASGKGARDSPVRRTNLTTDNTRSHRHLFPSV